MVVKMNRKQRFSFGVILRLMAFLYILIFVLEIIILLIFSIENKEVNLSSYFALQDLLIQLISLFFNAAFLFFAINAFYRRIEKRGKIIHFAKPVFLGVLAQLTYHCLMFFLLGDDNIILSNNDLDVRDQLPLGLMSVSYFMSASCFVGIAFLIAYLTWLKDERKQHKILQEQKMQLEIQNTQANYYFLKAQINPHFLHNTLSFLYSKSLPHSRELSEGILTLSHIMRYALHESIAIDGKAPLKDEIDHLWNVIRINQLRFSNKLNVQLKIEGDISGSKIIPFVLITLVENALKHGDLKSTEHPVILNMRLEGRNFYFFSYNKKKTGAKELSTGIGLENLEKRLTLAYGNKYQFTIKDEAEFYTTQLTINPL